MADLDKQAITGMLPQEICEFLGEVPAFRGIQIFKWVASGADSFDKMHNLSKKMREQLKGIFTLKSLSISQELHDPDGTIKLQLSLKDKKNIEAVLLTDSSGRKTACVSCQAGCAMGCAFCQTGKLGFGRNLESAEIVEQFFLLEKIAGKLDNIVFMGMGEPMMNLDAIRKTVLVLTHPEGRALSSRRITISTSGIIKGIYDLADNGPHIRLAVSLTTADVQLREQLMPITKTNPLHLLKEAILYYTEKTGKRCTLEAALLAGKNTGKESARHMVDFAKGLDVHINLIPWNPVDNLPFFTPASKECTDFANILEQSGLNVTLRTRRGQKIGGACGQLGKITLE